MQDYEISSQLALATSSERPHANERLFAVMRAFDEIEGPVFGDWVFEVLIFEGEMPPMPGALEPPAE